MTRISGFGPIIGNDCRVLILGSMPSTASLQEGQYYAHPRNAFWSIIEELFDIKRDLDYAERCNLLAENGVGVWDVLHTCVRPGSMDSDIEKGSEQINDFPSLFAGYPRIRAVFFNGGKAEQMFHRYVLTEAVIREKEMDYIRLPSTSPAYASMGFVEKVEQWRKLLEYLQ